jgi:hypothetical protein
MHPNLVAKFILSGSLVKIFTAELLISDIVDGFFTRYLVIELLASVLVAKVFIRSFFVRIFVVVFP